MALIVLCYEVVRSLQSRFVSYQHCLLRYLRACAMESFLLSTKITKALQKMFGFQHIQSLKGVGKNLRISTYPVVKRRWSSCCFAVRSITGTYWGDPIQSKRSKEQHEEQLSQQHLDLFGTSQEITSRELKRDHQCCKRWGC